MPFKSMKKLIGLRLENLIAWLLERLIHEKAIFVLPRQSRRKIRKSDGTKGEFVTYDRLSELRS